VVIEALADGAALGNQLTLDGDALSARRLSSSDTASLLPGVNAAQNGGVACAGARASNTSASRPAGTYTIVRCKR